jgi:hypothetical protein
MTAQSAMDLCEILPPGHGSTATVLVIVDGRFYERGGEILHVEKSARGEL